MGGEDGALLGAALSLVACGAENRPRLLEVDHRASLAVRVGDRNQDERRPSFRRAHPCFGDHWCLACGQKPVVARELRQVAGEVVACERRVNGVHGLVLAALGSAAASGRLVKGRVAWVEFIRAGRCTLGDVVGAASARERDRRRVAGRLVVSDVIRRQPSVCLSQHGIVLAPVVWIQRGGKIAGDRAVGRPVQVATRANAHSERGARVCRAPARVAVSSLAPWNSAEFPPARILV